MEKGFFETEIGVRKEGDIPFMRSGSYSGGAIERDAEMHLRTTGKDWTPKVGKGSRREKGKLPIRLEHLLGE